MTTAGLPRKETAQSISLWQDSGFLIAAILALACGLLLSYLSILRHQTFNSTGFDLGYFDQALWNTVHGRVLHSTLVVASPEHTNYFAEHVSPILLPLSLLYLPGSDVRVLLAFQGFTTALGMVPMYFLARLRWDSRPAAVMMAAAYVAFPTVFLSNLFDYHPDMLIVPLLPAAFYFTFTGRFRAFLLTALALLSLKETVALVVFALAIYLAIRTPQRRLGLALAIISLIWLYVCVTIIGPYFRGAPYHHLSRYSEFGDSAPAILLNMATHPMALLSLLGQQANLVYLLTLLLPLAALPLFSPLEVAIALPTLLVNMLSTVPSQNSLAYQYSVPVASFLFLATIEAIRRFQGWSLTIFRRPSVSKVLPPALSVLLLALTASVTLLVTTQMLAKTPFVVPSNAADIVAAASTIPPDASLATNNALAPHYTHRADLRLFPPLESEGGLVWDDPDYILVNLRDNRRTGIPEDHFSGAQSMASIVASLIDPAVYEVTYSQNDVVLFRRRSSIAEGSP